MIRVVPAVAAICALALTAAVPTGARQAAGPAVYALDAGASHIAITVDKAGLFSFAGHTHEVVAPMLAGEVRYDPAAPGRSTVRIEVDAAALKVTGKGEPPEDVPEVQRVMLSDRVLDVARYPTIAFVSRSVTVVDRDADRLVLSVTGVLTLHGTTRPLTVRVAARADAGGVSASGAFALKQTDFGIQPVTAAAGTVKVKDEVRVEFSVVARRSQEEAAR